MPSFDIDPCAQLAIKACLTAMACLLDGDAVAAIQAQADFAASANADLKVKVDGQNACFLAAIALAFAAAGQPMPAIPPMPTLPDLSSVIPRLPAIPAIPTLPGINITFGPDGVTPIRISY